MRRRCSSDLRLRGDTNPATCCLLSSTKDLGRNVLLDEPDARQRFTEARIAFRFPYDPIDEGSSVMVDEILNRTCSDIPQTIITRCMHESGD